MLKRCLFWLIFILLITALIVNYSINLFSGVKFDKEGNLIFEEMSEPGAPIKAPQFSQNYLGWQNFSKKDLLFVAWYQLKLDLGKDIGSQISDLNFSFSLPGEIIKHNATRIEAGSAIWESIPPDGKLILETRLIRWWLIFLVVALVFFGIWLKRQKAKT